MRCRQFSDLKSCHSRWNSILFNEDSRPAGALSRVRSEFFGLVEALVSLGVLASLFVLSAGGCLHRLSRNQVPKLDVVYGGQPRRFRRVDSWASPSIRSWSN